MHRFVGGGGREWQHSDQGPQWSPTPEEEGCSPGSSRSLSLPHLPRQCLSPRDCSLHLHFFSPWPRGRASGDGKQAKRRRGFPPPLKSICIPNRVSYLTISTVLGKTPEELPGGAPQSTCKGADLPGLNPPGPRPRPRPPPRPHPRPGPRQDLRGP